MFATIHDKRYTRVGQTFNEKQGHIYTDTDLIRFDCKRKAQNCRSIVSIMWVKLHGAFTSLRYVTLVHYAETSLLSIQCCAVQRAFELSYVDEQNLSYVPTLSPYYYADYAELPISRGAIACIRPTQFCRNLVVRASFCRTNKVHLYFQVRYKFNQKVVLVGIYVIVFFLQSLN